MKKLLTLVFLFLAVLQVNADTWTDSNGISWTFTVSGSNATDVKPSNRNSISGEVVIPSTMNSYTVTSIAEEAFLFCYGLTSVTIPNSVTYIGDEAFGNCRDLTSVTIGNSVTSIGWATFGGCISLTSVTIPNSVTEIGIRAFYACSSLTSVTIGNSVTSIAEEAFGDCISLTSVTIPNSVTSIGNGAFSECSGLTSVTIGNSVTSIADGAFYECSGLTSITVESGNSVYDSRGNCNAIIKTSTNTLIVGCMNTIIPNSVTSIGIYAFRYCRGLTSITIPNSVTYIGEYAFYGCSGLTSVTIPNSVTSIGERAFEDCSSLTSVTIGNSVTSIGNYAFEYCSSLTSVTIGNSVTSIGNYAFQYCSSLTSIDIPNSVTTIGGGAFNNCSSLTSIDIPNSVTTISGGAFNNCSSLTSVTVRRETPPRIYYSFSTSTYQDATLYVPAGCIGAYSAANYWKNFEDIQQLPEIITMSSNGVSTFCSPYDLDFSNVSGLKAYIVSGFDPVNASLVLTPVTDVPAGTGLLLKGAGGEYTIPISSSSMVYANLLTGVTENTTISPTSGTNTNFILANGAHGIGFYTISETGEIPVGKAYLHLPTSAVLGPFMSIFDDEATVIEGIKADGQADDSYYDLQGRRVEHPAKGLYIVNGKKVIIK